MIIEWLGATKFRLTFNSKHGIILLQRSKAEHTVAQHFRTHQMAFTDFNSIVQVQEAFKIKYTEAEYIQYVDIEPSEAFLEEFKFSQRHINVFSSEAARCENVIYPVLRDVYKNYVE